MGCSFLYFMNSLRLLDRFFETTAESLYLTRQEFACLTDLSKKGYFPAATIQKLKAKKMIAEVPERGSKADIEKSVDPSVASTVAKFKKMKLKFLITEDNTMRQRLKGTGVKTIATIDIIAHMAKKGAITRAEALSALEALRTFQWYDSKVLDTVVQRVRR